MTERTKPVVLNYCGYKVDVFQTFERVFDPQRGELVRAKVRYPDGFIAKALLRQDEIVREKI